MQIVRPSITTCQINKQINTNLILVELISFGIHSRTISMLCWSTKHAHFAATFQQQFSIANYYFHHNSHNYCHYTAISYYSYTLCYCMNLVITHEWHRSQFFTESRLSSTLEHNQRWPLHHRRGRNQLHLTAFGRVNLSTSTAGRHIHYQSLVTVQHACNCTNLWPTDKLRNNYTQLFCIEKMSQYNSNDSTVGLSITRTKHSHLMSWDGTEVQFFHCKLISR